MKDRHTRMLDQIARALSSAGLSANAATLIGFAVSFLAAYFIVLGEFLVGACLILYSGFFDLLDGRIARLRGTEGGFGALLDSSLDRLSDAVYYGAILIYFAAARETFYVFLTLSALAGSFEISYIRARAEGLSQECHVGFWERGERVVFLVLGLALNNVKLAILCLGILTHLTALERLFFARSRMLMEKGTSGGEVWNRLGKLKNCLFTLKGRRSADYLVKAVFFVLMVVFIKL